MNDLRFQLNGHCLLSVNNTNGSRLGSTYRILGRFHGLCRRLDRFRGHGGALDDWLRLRLLCEFGAQSVRVRKDGDRDSEQLR